MAIIRHVKLPDGSTHDVGVRESDIDWGTKNLGAGGYSVGDVYFNDFLKANRFAGLKAEGITIEYSTDAGSTWNEYSATDKAKRDLFSYNGGFYIAGSSSGTVTANSQLRITIDTGKAGIYTILRKFMIYISTNYSQNCKVTITAALQSTPDNYSLKICENTSIAGWSGWNVIPCNFATYGNTSATQYGRIRFLFTQTGLSDTSKKGGLIIQRIFAYGGVGWSTPSSMALHGHAYTWDGDMNVAFPASVTANTFNGPALQLQTYKQGSTTSTYGALYPVFAQWETGSIVKLRCSGYTTKVDTANTASTATNASALKGSDTRKTNQEPSWYISNHPWEMVKEFKETSAIGVNSIINNGNYCELITDIQYADASGGRPVQIAFNSEQKAIRYAVSNNAWSAWENISDTSALLNNLTTGSSTPTDADYYISQYVGGGTTTTTYHRRPMSALWNYIKGKFSGTSPITFSNGTIGINTASTSGYGATKLSTATNSTAVDVAATPSAVKTAYDLANSANTTANTALSGVNGNLIYDQTFTISNGVATFTPHVYQKGAEVTTNYAASCFKWKYRLIDGSEVNLTTNSNRGCTVTISGMGYGGHVIGIFTPS